jgi:hypothetical protein
MPKSRANRPIDYSGGSSSARIYWPGAFFQPDDPPDEVFGIPDYPACVTRYAASPIAATIPMLPNPCQNHRRVWFQIRRRIIIMGRRVEM